MPCGHSRLLGRAAKGLECFVPEAVEVVANGRKTLVVNRVKSSGALGSVGYETHVLEHLQVLRDGWSADRDGSGNVYDGHRARC